MALVLKDDVKESTSAAPGTGSFSLNGALAGKRPFSDIGNGNTTYYSAFDPVANVKENGIGTYTSSGDSLSRDTVLSNSSGTTSKISFANAPLVWCDYLAAKAVTLDFGHVVIDTTANLLTHFGAGAQIPLAVKTLGLNAVGDGGGGTFRYNAASVVSDNGGTIRVDGQSRRWYGAPDSPQQLGSMFGVVGDGTTDNAAAINAMLTWAYSQLLNEVWLPTGAVGIKSSIFITYGTWLRGQLNVTGTNAAERPVTQLVTLSGASYTGSLTVVPVSGSNVTGCGVMVGFNTTNMTTQAASGFFFGGGLKDICFNDLSGSGGAGIGNVIGCVFFGVDVEMNNVGGRGMLQTVVRGALPGYSDNFRIIKPFYSDSANAQVPQFDLYGDGDATIVEGGNFPPDQSFALRFPLVASGQTFGATVRDCINGSIYTDANHITIDGWHSENSYLLIGPDANVTLNDPDIFEDTTLTNPPIQITSALGNSQVVKLNGAVFHWEGSPSQFYSSCAFDVAIGAQTRLVVKNCRRSVNGVDSNITDTGIRICQSDLATPVPNWASYADQLSRDGEITNGYNVFFDKSTPPFSSNYQGPFNTNVKTAPSGSWQIATGTYYYTAVRLLDQQNLIGMTPSNGEVSATVSSTAHLVAMTGYCAAGTAGQGPVQGMTRFYRGASSGSYNFYADVPLIAPDPANIVDDGTYIGGVPWVSRIAGAIDTIKLVNENVPYRLVGAGLLKNDVPITTKPGDAAVTLKVASDQVVIYSANITAGRAVTLPPIGRNGDRVRLTRLASATGAFNVSVPYGPSGGSTLNLAAPTTVASAVLQYVAGENYWELLEYGTA